MKFKVTCKVEGGTGGDLEGLVSQYPLFDFDAMMTDDPEKLGQLLYPELYHVVTNGPMKGTVVSMGDIRQQHLRSRYMERYQDPMLHEVYSELNFLVAKQAGGKLVSNIQSKSAGLKQNIKEALKKAYAFRVVQLNHATRDTFPSLTRPPASPGVPAYTGFFASALLMSAVDELGADGVGMIDAAGAMYNESGQAQQLAQKQRVSYITQNLSSRRRSALVRKLSKRIASAPLGSNPNAILKQEERTFLQFAAHHPEVMGLGQVYDIQMRKLLRQAANPPSGWLSQQITQSTRNVQAAQAALAEDTQNTALQNRLQRMQDRLDQAKLAFTHYQNRDRSALVKSYEDLIFSTDLHKARTALAQYRPVNTLGSSEVKRYPQNFVSSVFNNGAWTPLVSVGEPAIDQNGQLYVDYTFTILGSGPYAALLEKGYSGWGGGYEAVQAMQEYVQTTAFAMKVASFL